MKYRPHLVRYPTLLSYVRTTVQDREGHSRDDPTILLRVDFPGAAPDRLHRGQRAWMPPTARLTLPHG